MAGLATIASVKNLAAAPSELNEALAPQPTPMPGNGAGDASDILVETLIVLGRDPRLSWHCRATADKFDPCVCVGTTPGAIHLMNGLYEAALDGAPVVALTGLHFPDLRGVRFQQGVDTVKLMQSVALYNEEVTGPEHALIIGNRACRIALAERGVAHLTVSGDVQMMKLAADKRSIRDWDV